MSEPRKLYSPDGSAMAIVYTPSQMALLQAEGWTQAQPSIDVAPAVTEVTPDTPIAAPAAPVAKRGRPKKTT